MRDSAIVIGGNHHNTLGLIRGLGRKGIKSVVILHSTSLSNYVLRSKYIDSYIIAKTDEEIIDALMQRKAEEKKVVICTSDRAASIIDCHRDILQPYFLLPGSPVQGTLTELMNKEKMSNTASDCGLNIPKSLIIEYPFKNLERIPYPCITKPISSIEGSKADIFICKNETELRKYLVNCHTKKLQVQEFIDKVMEYQLIGVAYNNITLIPGRSRILTQPKSTNTGYLHYEKIDGTEPLPQCKEFLRRTGYSGLFSMEFIRDNQGKDYFMEINFRNDGNSICVTDAGVNLPYMWYKANTDRSFDLSKVKADIKEIHVIPEFNEIEFWYTRQIPFLRMIKELYQADSYMEYASDDPSPTKGKREFCWRMVKAIIKWPFRLLIKR